jgi:hypothetical protein
MFLSRYVEAVASGTYPIDLAVLERELDRTIKPKLDDTPFFRFNFSQIMGRRRKRGGVHFCADYGTRKPNDTNG